jgi:hypothetical protein
VPFFGRRERFLHRLPARASDTLQIEIARCDAEARAKGARKSEPEEKPHASATSVSRVHDADGSRQQSGANRQHV